MNMRSPDKRLKIGILGAKGLLGSDLVRLLSRNFKVEAITKENYKKKVGTYFDCLINANGNSKRFWANENPFDDFLASTLSVYKSIFDFPSDLYIYISSPDVYSNHENPKYSKETAEMKPLSLEAYGFNKYLSELIVKKYSKKYLILRCSMILGKKLKKGPIFDLLKDNSLYVNLQTKLQIITTKGVSEILITLLEKSVSDEIINVGGKGTFNFKRAKEYFKRSFKIRDHAKKQVYEMNIEKLLRFYPSLKTSKEYLKEYLKQQNV